MPELTSVVLTLTGIAVVTFVISVSKFDIIYITTGTILSLGMARVIGHNDHLSKLARTYRDKAIVLALVYPISVALSILNPLTIPLSVGISALASYKLWKVAGKLIKYRKGLKGEIRVEEVLKGLNDGYVIFNNVKLPNGNGNIDHVVIGPTGVFAIETKNIRGNFVCEGDEWFKVKNGKVRKIRSISRQAKRNALALRKFLRKHGCDQFVYSLVVLTNENCRVDLINPSVPVIEVSRLKEFIENSKFRVSKRRIHEIVGILVSELK